MSLLPGDLSLSVEDADAPDARAVLQRYFTELSRRFPEGYDAVAALDDARTLLTPPGGRLVLARRGAAVVGCAGLHFLDADTAEVRRLFVDPAARGLGIGRALLGDLEVLARAAGRHVLVLDTHAVLEEALGLYRSAGYRPIPAYNDNLSAHFWFEKRLCPDVGSARRAGRPDANAPEAPTSQG